LKVPRFISAKLASSLSQIGREGLNQKYPNEFEAYLIAFELTDSIGTTEEYFVFPVMPSQIQKTENNRTTIKKSSAGTTVLYSSSFTPNDISLKGNFGRGFKLLTKYDADSTAFGIGLNFGKLSAKTPTFDATVKTGYGATKILQRICTESSKLDWRGNPKRLYFYNLALSEQYLCVVPSGGLSLSQTYESNMIWNYSLNLSILANLEDLKSESEIKSSSSTLLKSSAIQKGITGLVRDVSMFTQGGTNKILAAV